MDREKELTAEHPFRILELGATMQCGHGHIGRIITMLYVVNSSVGKASNFQMFVTTFEISSVQICFVKFYEMMNRSDKWA